MSNKAKKLNTEKVSDANLLKSSKKYSKKQVVSSQTSLKRVSEKELQLTEEVNIKHINRKELFFEKTSHNPPVCNMSQFSTSKSTRSLLEDGTILPENGAYKGVKVGEPIDLYGKDWDEMEFLESSVSNKNYNDSIRTTNEALNGKYARTRRNLAKTISADTAVANGLDKKTSIQSSKTGDKHLSSYSTKSKISTLKQLTKHSSVLNSPMKSMSPHEIPLNSASFNKASSSKEDKPTLLDMVKKFSASANLAPSDSTTYKTVIQKSNSSFKNYMNKLRSEPPRAKSVSSVSLQSLVPESIEISLVPNTSKSPLKNSNSSHVKNNNLKKNTLIRKQSVVSNSKQVEKSNQAIRVKQSTEKRHSEPVDNAAKKSKNTKNEKANIINETIHNTSLSNSNITNVVETGHISDKEISSWLDEEMIKGTEELKKKDSSNVNSTSQVFTLDSGLDNSNVLNPTSYIFTPTLPNSLSNTFIPSSMNNLIYDVNSLSLYQPVAPPASTTVFILPVSSNFSTVPNTPNHMNSLPPSQPIVKVSCNGMDADSVFKHIYNTFYQPTETGTQKSESASATCPETSNNTVQTNSQVHTSASSSTSTQQPETCDNHLLIPKTSDIVREVSTGDRGSLLLSYFCGLMKNDPKRSLQQYRTEANEVLDVLSSFPHCLSVKHFCNNAEEFFSDFCFSDPASQCTVFKFEKDFQESDLSEVIKKYVSFQAKEIVKDSPGETFCVKSNFLFKARNSKLTYFEKLILKKLLKNNQSVDLDVLLSRLFLVGLVVVFSELKKQRQQ